ncbi:UDP-N-acetylmuramoyl-L-alanyl-D-glutamate--2,6-diaminopimelate ligase [Zhongshania aliphaticivorans]|uniref:UDP-N-acetylmuramoyl-L-alanyl-D-glutamate--2,6-diaminopimelate ligase n=1 Tax=Zhongshania aliphaticivorans TaxID=1470434 RepID=A0A5S9N415_9GAMM|nr:UDP-N-acetylmuramoyl-L-alanyl-D-glutamate--2,6-diaminopimelate ligase [Zhongshania aliphaticivorans]CAA0083168.1 UDP-N-acetylmuramoyl-L-alanyl-D-glutamate--2,6-diaminopimelate ligase [Zhongshania aliphaticivorans]CAA0083594.1 UDP-N-acetylmuramoyl-L-alanyl-D-glutamate--2,6-diaminopimelate ligase [Zhongshania aliphaticivorans]
MTEQQDYTVPRLLGDLLPGLSAEVAAVPVTGLALDSRNVRPGDVFLAVNGHSVDGRDYIKSAIQSGAVAVVADAPFDAAQWSLPVIVVEDLSAKLSDIAGQFFDHPSSQLKLIGITGTNGKTSCAWMVAQLLEVIGEPCGLIGTLGNGRFGRLNSGNNTTPDAVSVQALLSDWRDGGAGWAAMEVSSHGLAQHRVAALQFTAAVFTNLTQDHLDYHGSMEAYGEEKSRLFRWSDLQLAVINRDDEFGRQLIKRSKAQRVVDFSVFDNRAMVYAEDVHCDMEGIRARLLSAWGDLTIKSSLLGGFNLSNLLAAITVLLGLGVPAKKIEAALPSLKPVPGRMECLRSADNVLVVVDYAHTPDALQKVLETLRPIIDGQIISVMGCGGDRDKSKRPLMGAIVEQYSDRVWVTNDNPRTESADAIVADICEGMRKQPAVELERDVAINTAIRTAKPGDAVLLAGKGHENYQEIAGRRLPFSDLQCARLALAARSAL